MNESIELKTETSLNDLSQEYFKSIEHKSDYKNTLCRYENHVKPYLGKYNIKEITTRDILNLKYNLTGKISEKTKRKLSNKTINDMINLVSTMYNFHNRLNFKDKIENPASKDLVQRYVQDNARLRFLSKSEYYKLLEMIENRNDLTKHKNTSSFRTKEMLLYVKLLVTTGMRTYSALTIRAKDINIEDRKIKVKNHKANREYFVFIHKSIFDELVYLKESINDNKYIFGLTDKPYHRSTINKRLKPILDLLFNQGVEDRKEKVVVHTLRHTFGSWLAQQGVSLYKICKLMDHKDISMTQRYSKLTEDSGRSDVDRLL